MMNSLSIVFMLGTFSIGGVERVTVVLANEFIKRGYHVAVFSCKIKDKMLLNNLNSQVDVIELPFKGFSSKNCNLLRKYVEEKNVDYIINQWCTPYKVTSFLKKATKASKTKLISVHHNRPDTNKRIQDAKNPLFRKVLNLVTQINLWLTYYNSDSYVVLCESFIRLLKKYIYIDGDKIISIGNPLTLSPIERKKEDLIIYVGRLEETQKRVSRIFDAKYEWPIIIVGDGPDRNKYEKLCMGRNDIKFVGFHNPTEYYARAKILLLTSDFEGFPLVLCEAMAFGCVPVVLNTFSSASEIIGDGGVIVEPPYNTETYASAVKSLILDSKRLNILSEKAKRRSLDYNVESIVDKWENLFTSLSEI